MKIKNVMFSGVMAAILMMSVGAAMAEGETAAISVASTGYVEAKVGALETSVQGVYQTKADAKTAADAQKLIDDKQTQDIKSNTEAINMLGGESGAAGVATLVSDVNTNKTAISTLNAGAETEGSVAHSIANAVIQQSQVQDLETALGGKADKTTIGDVPADKTVVQMITEAQSAATYDDAQVKADIAQNKTDIATKASASDLTNLANAVNDAEKGLAKTNEIAVANQGAIATLNGADTEAGSVANTVKTKVEGYAVPKPGDNCAHAKCVLSVDQGGNPYWMELALSL